MINSAGNRVVSDSAISYTAVQVIKGLAVLLMVYHHCCGFPEWYVNVPDFFRFSVLVKFADSAKICVGLFAFLTGWTYYHHKDKSYVYSGKKIVTFLLHYWVALILSLGVAVGLCSWHPGFLSLVYEFFPVSQHPLMWFVWYVWFYVLLMLILPMAHICDTKLSGFVKVTVVVVGIVFMLIVAKNISLFSDLHWITYSFLGYFCARRRVFEMLIEQAPAGVRYAFLISIGCFALSFLTWHYHMLAACRGQGSLLAPVFFIVGVLMYLKFIDSRYLAVVACFFGKHAMNIWFLHGLFFSIITREWMQKTFLISTNLCYIYCVVLFISLFLSIAIMPIQKQISKLVCSSFRFFSKG